MQPENAAPSAPRPGQIQLSPRWLIFAALALAVPLGTLFLSRPDKPRLPVLVDLPPFQLTDQLGRPFGKKEMLGRVWVANFIFTSCAEACPRLTQKVRGIQDRLTPAEQAGAIGLVSLTVDPERDTPQRLREYAQSFGVNEAVWRFVTGPQAEVERTVVQGFRVAMAKVKPEPEPGSPQAVAVAPAATQADAAKEQARIHAEAFDIVHGEQLVLVDVQGRIRGYYTADEKGTERLLRDARLLAGGGA
jgi:protein SCO1/2